MKFLKSIAQIAGFLVIVGGSFMFGFAGAWVYKTKYMVIEEPNSLPSIIDIQRAVGARPDGIIGPETLSKWETAYANQEAAKFMTPSKE